MHPVQFECQTTISAPADVICTQIADVTRWCEFQGYGFLPGIASAEYEQRTANMVGSRIRVTNTDGSYHMEEFTVWENGRKIVTKLHDFSPPLNRLTTHFLEEWNFETRGNATHVRRALSLFPKQALARPALWLISRFLRQAITRQLDEMTKEAKTLAHVTQAGRKI